MHIQHVYNGADDISSITDIYMNVTKLINLYDAIHVKFKSNYKLNMYQSKTLAKLFNNYGMQINYNY